MNAGPLVVRMKQILDACGAEINQTRCHAVLDQMLIEVVADPPAESGQALARVTFPVPRTDLRVPPEGLVDELYRPGTHPALTGRRVHWLKVVFPVTMAVGGQRRAGNASRFDRLDL